MFALLLGEGEAEIGDSGSRFSAASFGRVEEEIMQSRSVFRARFAILAFITFLAAGLALVPTAHAQGIEWTRQFGTSEFDRAQVVSADASGIYVFGATGGTLPGQTSAGGTDVFVRKYDADGTEVWTLQFGTSSVEFTVGISVAASGIYVAGGTAGTLPGQAANAGDFDAFVVKIAHLPGPPGGVPAPPGAGAPPGTPIPPGAGPP